MTENKPNFVFITIDSFRRDFCSLYNDDEPNMPTLKSLAEDSTVFNRAIAPSTWTLQAHGSLFTGLYPPEHNVTDKDQVLGSHPTIAELLSSDGYTTEAFGRNGWLESGEILRGFRHHRTGNTIHIRNEFDAAVDSAQNGNLAEGIKQLGNVGRAFSNKIRRSVFRHEPLDQRTVDNYTRRLAERSAESTFCDFIHLAGVHYPYQPRSPYHTMFGDHSLLERMRNISFQQELIENRARIFSHEYDIDQSKVNVMEDLYRGCIRQTDDLLDQLFASFETNDLMENTIIVILSDHGDRLGRDKHFGHQFTVDDAVVRVPLVVYDPTNSISTDRVDDIVQLNDLYPTMLSIAGVEPPETNSVNLLEETRESAYVYYQAAESFCSRLEKSGVDRDQFLPLKQYAVWKSPENKLVWYPDEGRYDGPKPDDTELGSSLQSHFDRLEPVNSTNEEKQIDTELEQNLRELGYL